MWGKLSPLSHFREAHVEDGHEIIDMSDLSAVEGAITQQAERRRSERKHYVCLDSRSC